MLEEQCPVCITTVEYNTLVKYKQKSEILQQANNQLLNQKQIDSQTNQQLQNHLRRAQINTLEMREKLSTLDGIKLHLEIQTQALQKVIQQNRHLKAQIQQRNTQDKGINNEQIEYMKTKLFLKLKQIQKLNNTVYSLGDENTRLLQTNSKLQSTILEETSRSSSLTLQIQRMTGLLQKQIQMNKSLKQQLEKSSPQYQKDLQPMYMCQLRSVDKIKPTQQQMNNFYNMMINYNIASNFPISGFQVGNNLNRQLKQKQTSIAKLQNNRNGSVWRIAQLSNEVIKNEPQIQMQRLHRKMQGTLSDKYEYLNNYYLDLERNMSQYNVLERFLVAKKDIESLIEFLNQKLYNFNREIRQ